MPNFIFFNFLTPNSQTPKSQISIRFKFLSKSKFLGFVNHKRFVAGLRIDIF